MGAYLAGLIGEDPQGIPVNLMPFEVETLLDDPNKAKDELG